MINSEMNVAGDEGRTGATFDVLEKPTMQSEKLLSCIFGYLPMKDLSKCRQVSKYWHQISMERWRKYAELVLVNVTEEEPKKSATQPSASSSSQDVKASKNLLRLQDLNRLLEDETDPFQLRSRPFRIVCLRDWTRTESVNSDNRENGWRSQVNTLKLVQCQLGYHDLLKLLGTFPNLQELIVKGTEIWGGAPEQNLQPRKESWVLEKLKKLEIDYTGNPKISPIWRPAIVDHVGIEAPIEQTVMKLYVVPCRWFFECMPNLVDLTVKCSNHVADLVLAILCEIDDIRKSDPSRFKLNLTRLNLLELLPYNTSGTKTCLSSALISSYLAKPISGLFFPLNELMINVGCFPTENGNPCVVARMFHVFSDTLASIHLRRPASFLLPTSEMYPFEGVTEMKVLKKVKLMGPFQTNPKYLNLIPKLSHLEMIWPHEGVKFKGEDGRIQTMTTIPLQSPEAELWSHETIRTKGGKEFPKFTYILDQK